MLHLENSQAGGQSRVLADYLTEAELSAQIDRTLRTLRYWRKHRRGPPWTAIGSSVIYRRESVRKWLLDQEHQPVRPRHTR